MEDEIHQELDRLRGKLAGFIEACGLDPKQERPIVSHAKSLTYDAERAILKIIAEGIEDDVQ